MTKWLVTLLSVTILGCHDEGLNQSNEPSLIVSADWIELSWIGRTDEFCVNKHGEVYFPINYRTTTLSSMQTPLGEFDNNSTNTTILFKYSDQLRMLKKYQFTATSDDSYSFVLGCDANNDDLIAFSSRQEGDFEEGRLNGGAIYFFDRDLNYQKTLNLPGNNPNLIVSPNSIEFRDEKKLAFNATFFEGDNDLKPSGDFIDQNHATYGEIDIQTGNIEYKASISSSVGVNTTFGVFQTDGDNIIAPFSSMAEQLNFLGNSIEVPSYEVPQLDINYLVSFNNKNREINWVNTTLPTSNHGNNSAIRNLIKVNDGFIVVQSGGDRYIDNTFYPRFGLTDIFVYKLSFNGKLEWLKQFGSGSNDVGDLQAQDVDENGNIYLSFVFNGTILSPAELAGIEPGGSRDLIVVKLAPNGKVINHLVIETVDVYRSPLLKVFNGMIYYWVHLRDFIRTQNLDIDFTGKRRIYLMKMKL